MVEEMIISCPFCKEQTVKVLHQPFVVTKSLSKSRFGAGGPRYSKEKTDVLSGCEKCGKTLKDIEDVLNDDKPKRSHEERLARLKAAGLPMMIENKRD